MDRPEKGRVRPLSLQEELGVLREDPSAQELLCLLADQEPERIDQLVTTLTTLAEQEERYAQANER